MNILLKFLSFFKKRLSYNLAVEDVSNLYQQAKKYEIENIQILPQEKSSARILKRPSARQLYKRSIETDKSREGKEAMREFLQQELEREMNENT